MAKLGDVLPLTKGMDARIALGYGMSFSVNTGIVYNHFGHAVPEVNPIPHEIMVRFSNCGPKGSRAAWLADVQAYVNAQLDANDDAKAASKAAADFADNGPNLMLKHVKRGAAIDNALFERFVIESRRWDWI